jgi:hypothetical protein
VLIIKKAHKGTKIPARMQGARARNLRKVKKMQENLRIVDWNLYI